MFLFMLKVKNTADASAGREVLLSEPRQDRKTQPRAEEPVSVLGSRA